MTNIPQLLPKPRFRQQPDPRHYELLHDELLEYPGYSNTRAICHLRSYTAHRSPIICLVGNFDEILGTSTSNVVEVVTTAVADRIGTDRFRLIHWFPHSPLGVPSNESRLQPVPATRIEHGQTLIKRGPYDYDTVLRRTTTTRFVNPEWQPVQKRQLSRLLGDEALYELHALAGIKGEYLPERVFGSHGRDLADAIRVHNDAQAEMFKAQLREGGVS